MRFLVFCIAFHCLCSAALGLWQISKLIDSQSVEIHWAGDDEPSYLEVGQFGILHSASLGTAVGFGRIHSAKECGDEIPCYLVRISVRESNRLILPGDVWLSPNLSTMDPRFKGRANLLVSGREVSSRYKQLAFFGAYTGDGHTLDAGEVLFDIFLNVQYGLSPRWTLMVRAPLLLLAIPSIGIKWKAIDTDSLTLTQSFLPAYSFSDRSGLIQLRTLVSVPSTTRMISHTAVNITASTHPLTNLGERRTFLRSSLQSGYEYILENWDRLVFGPSYNFDLRSVGGYFSYLFIWDRFHLGLGVEAQDFSRIEISTEGYLPTFSLFWRL